MSGGAPTSDGGDLDARRAETLGAVDSSTELSALEELRVRALGKSGFAALRAEMADVLQDMLQPVEKLRDAVSGAGNPLQAVAGCVEASLANAGLAVQGVSGRLGGDPDQFAAETGAPVVPQRAGHLRFVVDPWARVEIDGQEVLTTPSAREIALPPGRHFVRLENPYFQPIDREVWVREGETDVIEETLVELTAEPEGEAP